MSRSEVPETRKPVIVQALRTPIGRANGTLCDVEPEDLAAPILRELVEKSGLLAGDVDDVILGNATGGGGNIARLAALRAGLPTSVAGVTVDRQCGSGLEAIIMACNLVAAGAGDVFLAGGVESTSRAPIRMRRPTNKDEEPVTYSRARFSPDEIGDPEMGVAAENVAQKFGISRDRADRFALRSHQRACSAQQDGRFDDEILQIVSPSNGRVLQDECPRSDTSLEKLAALPAVFVDDGTVTAGNSCPLNDGACVVLVTSLATAKRINARHLLSYEGGASAGVDPNLLGIGPVASTRKLVKKHPELSPKNADLIEFNEAFAAQVLASIDALEIDEDRINLDGGALAIGHPFGASGAVLVTRLFHQLKARETSSLGLAMMGIGGGMGLTAGFRYKQL